MGALALGLLSTHAQFLSAADLQWGRAAQAQQGPTVQELVEQEFDAPTDKAASEITTPNDLSQGSAVMAAAWEDDDALAAELETAPSEVVSENDESRGDTNPLNTVDPFEADDRTAQLPEDLFEEPAGEPIPQLEERIDAIEDAVENEIDRRRSEPEELLQEPQDSKETDTFESESLEEEPSDDAEERSQTDNQNSTQGDLNFQLQTPAKQQPEVVRPYQEEQDARMADELSESQERCEEELAALRSDRINSVDLSIRVDGVAGEDYPYECALGDEKLEPRVWPEITYTWKASALCHKPLYFEQVQLERYGHSWPRCVQPIMSGAHFFGSVAILPYKMGIETPTECIYALGHYRPGSCAPYYIEAFPFTWRAAAFQTGAITGIHFALP